MYTPNQSNQSRGAGRPSAGASSGSHSGSKVEETRRSYVSKLVVDFSRGDLQCWQPVSSKKSGKKSVTQTGRKRTGIAAAVLKPLKNVPASHSEVYETVYVPSLGVCGSIRSLSEGLSEKFFEDKFAANIAYTCLMAFLVQGARNNDGVVLSAHSFMDERGNSVSPDEMDVVIDDTLENAVQESVRDGDVSNMEAKVQTLKNKILGFLTRISQDARQHFDNMATQFNNEANNDDRKLDFRRSVYGYATSNAAAIYNAGVTVLGRVSMKFKDWVVQQTSSKPKTSHVLNFEHLLQLGIELGGVTYSLSELSNDLKVNDGYVGLPDSNAIAARNIHYALNYKVKQSKSSTSKSGGKKSGNSDFITSMAKRFLMYAGLSMNGEPLEVKDGKTAGESWDGLLHKTRYIDINNYKTSGGTGLTLSSKSSGSLSSRLIKLFPHDEIKTPIDQLLEASMNNNRPRMAEIVLEYIKGTLYCGPQIYSKQSAKVIDDVKHILSQFSGQEADSYVPPVTSSAHTTYVGDI